MSVSYNDWSAECFRTLAPELARYVKKSDFYWGGIDSSLLALVASHLTKDLEAFARLLEASVCTGVPLSVITGDPAVLQACVQAYFLAMGKCSNEYLRFDVLGSNLLKEIIGLGFPFPNPQHHDELVFEELDLVQRMESDFYAYCVEFEISPPEGDTTAFMASLPTETEDNSLRTGTEIDGDCINALLARMYVVQSLKAGAPVLPIGELPEAVFDMVQFLRSKYPDVHELLGGGELCVAVDVYMMRGVHHLCPDVDPLPPRPKPVAKVSNKAKARAARTAAARAAKRAREDATGSGDATVHESKRAICV